MRVKASLASRLLCVVFLLLFLRTAAATSTIYVDADAPGANNGSSWENAYIFLQDALADAETAEKPLEIRVAQGIYKPDQGANQIPRDRGASFQLINNVTLKGGYAGGELDVRDVEVNETILSGDLNSDDVEVAKPEDLEQEPTCDDNSYNVVTGSGTDATAVLDGFTITGGNADSSLKSEYPVRNRLKNGGGMFNYEGSPTLTDCIFSGNFATGGGGIFNFKGSPTLTECIFRGNCTAGNGGSGMYNYHEANPTLTNCTFSGNFTAGNGGGMGNDYFSNPILTNCIFSGNSAERNGGGMWIYRTSSSTLTNCTFAQNSALYGNALFCHTPATRSNVELINCILWNGGDEISENYPCSIIMTYSNIQGDFPGEGNIDTDPCFVDSGYWANADDPNIVAEPNDPNAVWINGDYHLKSQAGRWDPFSESWVFDDVTSPCIDAGDPNSPVAFEPSPNGGIINMGAYGCTGVASKSPSGIHAKYGGGTGESNDPYLINTTEQMNTIGLHGQDWDKNFKLMTDIDLSIYTGTDFNIIGDLDRPFTGVFDGNGHIISNFTYDSDEAGHIGFFGNVGNPDEKTNPQIRNLGLINPNINAGTVSYIGSLVGHLRSGSITGCYVKDGRVSGSSDVGGIVGRIWWGTIINCHSIASITGDSHTGGILGFNYGGDVSSCFSNCNVTGNQNVGGLIGWNNFGTEITNCYSMGYVIGDEYVGGLVGKNISRENRPGTITNCYSVGRVIGNAHVGGLVGLNWGVVEFSFWDIQTGDWITSDGGTGKSTVEMQTARTFLNAGWDFVDETANGTDNIWWILEGQDYPRLWWELINKK